MVQRLFDHDQPELVQGLEHGRLGQSVGSVGVDRERRVGERLPHGPHHLDVAAGFDLQLHPLVARREVAPDLLEHRFDGWSDAHADPTRDAVAHPSQPLRDGNALGPSPGVQHGGLHRGLGHAMSPNPGRPGRHVMGVIDLAAVQDRRSQPPFDDLPRAVEPFVRIAGLLRGHALAPPLDVAGVGPDQDGPLVVFLAEAGAEGPNQRQSDLDQLDGPDPHASSSAGSNTYPPSRSNHVATRP